MEIRDEIDRIQSGRIRIVSVTITDEDKTGLDKELERFEIRLSS